MVFRRFFTDILLGRMIIGGMSVFFALIAVLLCLMLPGCGGTGNTDSANQRIEERRLYLAAYQPFLAADYQASIAALSDFIVTYPQAPEQAEAHYYLGRSYYGLEQWPQALEQFNLLLEQYGTGDFGDNARYWRGRVYHRQAQYDLARTEYAAVLGNYPQSNWRDNALLYTGLSYYDQARYTRAREFLTRVLTEYPGASSNDNARYYIGRSYQEEGQYAAALEAFKQLAIPASASSYADNAHYQIGKIYYVQGMYAEARAQFDSLVNQTVIYADYTATDEAQYYAVRSQHYLATSNTDFQDVRAAYDQFISAYPQHGLTDNAYYWQARTYYDAQDYSSALTRLRYLLSLTLSDSSAFDNALYYIGRCLQQMARARDLDPQAYPLSLYPDATYQGARDAYAILMQVPHITSSTLADNAHFQVALSYYDEASYVQAEQQLLGLIETVAYPYIDNSALDEAWFYLGRSYHQQAGQALTAATADGFYQLARDAYQALLNTYAASSLYADNAHFQTAKTYYDQADMATTIQQLSTLVSALVAVPPGLAYPDTNALDQSWYFLGRAYENQGLTNAAISAYEAVINQFPLSFYLASAQTHLASLNAALP